MTSRLLTRRRAAIGEALTSLEEDALQALGNQAYTLVSPSIHTPLADTTTAVLGMLLTVESSGIFDSAFAIQYAGAASDIVTYTVSVYHNTVKGTAMTIPTNAASTGINVLYDNSGAGIAPTAGASVGQQYSFTHTLAAANDIFSWDGFMIPIEQIGYQCYVTLSVANTVATRAVAQASCKAFELPGN